MKKTKTPNDFVIFINDFITMKNNVPIPVVNDKLLDSGSINLETPKSGILIVPSFEMIMLD